MSDMTNISAWPEKIRKRYENYLKTAFFFSDPDLRDSFQEALRKEKGLLKGPYPESHHGFEQGMKEQELAAEYFSDQDTDLVPALKDRRLYVHQEDAIRASYDEGRSVFVATGTASGKTESFLYPILFELYRQHLAGELENPGVRAMILYPMNALANDQRERLGAICEELRKAESKFKPTFGQYTGQTPENRKDERRNAFTRYENRLDGELVFRDKMRKTPPHILLTNYSMLEYLLIRPDDSPLFDNGLGKHWQFIVLDEAHQYRGAKGMEMGMLIRRLKQRLRDGGRQGRFQCIATSATISSGESEIEKETVAEFAQELFGEHFSPREIIFGKSKEDDKSTRPRRYHAFLRALEGAFLVHKEGVDSVVLNRKRVIGNGHAGEPLEIALCRECGQHYYVGRIQQGRLKEANRDPSHSEFGVDYYLPTDSGDEFLCRLCGRLSKSILCDCNASRPVKKCESHDQHPDRLKECETCGYRGGIGDPVQEIVHGSDGPNSVIATALHELLPEEKRKVLAFADNRQDAAFFAWYVENSYEKLRDRNFIFRAVQSENVSKEGLSIGDLQNRLLKQWEQAGLFSEADTREEQNRQVLVSILREAMTDEKRISLSGVGLVKWFVEVPQGLRLPDAMFRTPWNFTKDQARSLAGYMLDEMRSRRALSLPEGAGTPAWNNISSWPQQAFGKMPRSNRSNVSQWGAPQSSIVRHFLGRLLKDSGLSAEDKQSESIQLMKNIWEDALKTHAKAHTDDPVLTRAEENGTFRLNSRWLRVKPAYLDEIWECDTCATLSGHNIRGICPRNRCPGMLKSIDKERLKGNHYRNLYENSKFPPKLCAEEHTAQISTEEAHDKQDKFKNGEIHLLSSSTTFEVGVDLGDLESVFLRNVPPESFNYTQRAGRAGRRGTPGLVLTYCRQNPHDLYHFEDPDRVLQGKIRAPRLHMKNEKIIRRHMLAVALSAFFKENRKRFENVKNLVDSWEKPQAVSDLHFFCKNNEQLKESLCLIVPEDMHGKMGLEDNSWISQIAGEDSYLALVQEEVCADYTEMKELRNKYFEQGKDSEIARIGSRQKTIANEQTLSFLSRKAVIPKYGFPVDVVELDVRSTQSEPIRVTLQRDLSQAIAEYAPGGKVVANKKEWESCGLKKIHSKEWPVFHYRYDKARNFEQWNEGNARKPHDAGKYLIPKFGFVTPLFKKPSEPQRRAQRLYTTRPFFRDDGNQPEEKTISGVRVTETVPGTLVILCEGKNGEGFYICRSCGAHMAERKAKHKSPSNSECSGCLERFSLGHELVTDVVRLQFPGLHQEGDAYSVAYAVLLGAADTLEIPSSDLNVTITRGDLPNESAVVLYDNVPGGAGLVAQLEQEEIFRDMLRSAKKRVEGGCGCDISCYGCLRSYRNQFVHTQLDRERAKQILDKATI